MTELSFLGKLTWFQDKLSSIHSTCGMMSHASFIYNVDHKAKKKNVVTLTVEVSGPSFWRI